MSTGKPEPPEPLQGDSVAARLWRREAWRRCHIDNQHYMLCVVGREGTGKSYTALRLGEVFDPEFSAERVVFQPERMLELMDSDETGRGSVVILDESGVGLGNRSWYDKEQIKLNKALQTIRDHNLIGIFTLPRLHELDSQTRGRLHAYLEMTRVDQGNDRAVGKYKQIDVARGERDNIYTPYPRMRVNGRLETIQSISVGKPSADLIEQYEARKQQFQTELYEEVVGADDEPDDDDSPADVAELLIENEEWEEFVSEHGQTGRRYIDKDMLRAEYNLSHSDARSVKKLVEKEVVLDATEA